MALTLYALLPIVRSTVTGLSTIDRAIIEAGTAMGMTSRQLLLMVELPIALPQIVAGIRVATVIGVGTATIAAAVGAGGLGEYIFRGLAMVDTTTILAGAIPAAALALRRTARWRGPSAVARRSRAGTRCRNRCGSTLLTVLVGPPSAAAATPVVVGPRTSPSR